MGLLTKEVKIELNSRNIKHFEDKGYYIPRVKNVNGKLQTPRGTEIFVKIEDLSKGAHILVDIKCDGCNRELLDIKWQTYKRYVHDDTKYYCSLCAKNGYEKYISFYKWCYTNLPKGLADYILSRWDYELNIDKDGKSIGPQDVSHSSHGLNGNGYGYWFKCLEYPEHKSELKSINNFVSEQKGNIKCNQCNTISITDHHLEIFLVNKEDAKKYSRGSKIKIPMRCPDCGHEKERSMALLSKCGFACECCSDGLYYPNKFLFNFLKQINNLNIIKDFEMEKTFDWLKYEFKSKLHQGYLDGYFAINGENHGVEMDGAFHSTDNKMNGRTKEESKYIDDEKDRLCGERDIKVIRIDCIKSKWKYIKNSIMNSELPQLLNFKEEGIDWLKCHEAGLSNLVKICCNLWNDGMKNASSISAELKLSKTTIIRYLKQGFELGWSDYDSEEVSKTHLISMSENNRKKVICITTGTIFNSTTEAANEYKIKPKSIASCCRGEQSSYGKHPITKEPLVWQYYSEYIKSNSLPTAI